MGMSTYYEELRRDIGTRRIFSPSVAAIIKRGDDILFQYPGGSYWSLPAGAVELGESPAQAVVREVYEETGLIVRPVALLGVFGGEAYRLTYPDGNEVEYVATVFGCEVVSGELEAIDGESLDLRYFPSGERPPLALPYPSELFEMCWTDKTGYFDWKEEWLSAFKR